MDNEAWSLVHARSRGNARPDLMAWSLYGATRANALIGVPAVPAMRSGRTTPNRVDPIR